MAKKATAEMVAMARPPLGYEPISSSSPFGWENGPIFEKDNLDTWMRGFRVESRHTNAGGMCHGGMIMTFADIVLSRAVLETIPPPFVTVRLTTDFIGPAVLGDWVEGTASVHGNEDGVVSVSGKIFSEQGTVAGISALFKKLGGKARGA